MAAPRVVIFDLDSTLAESKQPITKEMAQMLKSLIDKVPVAIMSGADLPQYEHQLLPYLPADTKLENLFLFPTSAAECLAYTGAEWKDVYDYLISPEDKEKIMKSFDEVLEKTQIVFGQPSYGKRIEDRGEEITFSALGQEAPLELKEKWDPDHAKREKLVAELKKLIPDFNIKIGGTTSIDISLKNIDKATGINWLIKEFAVKPEEILYVGDALFKGGNDAAAFDTGVRTQQVSGPPETYKLIQELVTQLS